MSQKTLADTLAARESLYVNCGHPMCCKSTKLDVQALIDRLGPGSRLEQRRNRDWKPTFQRS